jgi:hypothetical protein
LSFSYNNQSSLSIIRFLKFVNLVMMFSILKIQNFNMDSVDIVFKMIQIFMMVLVHLKVCFVYYEKVKFLLLKKVTEMLI